ncbi:hypothetical protein D3C73_1010010 [compost metagenome]
MKRSGRSVAEASRVIEIDEVLEASRASGPSNGVSSAKTAFLTASSSDAASMMRSAAAASPRVATGAMRCSAAWASASVVRPRAARRARLAAISPSASVTRSDATSYSFTS